MQTISEQLLEDTMFYNEIPVFHYKISYPQFTTTCNPSSAREVNEYYSHASRKTESYCRTTLYQQAVENAKYIPKNQPPFHSYEFISEFHITYNNKCISSLYIDEYTFMGGAHGSTRRSSDTWDFSTGQPIHLKDLFPEDSSFPESILENIRGQIAGQLAAAPSSYFENYKSLVKDNFCMDCFYLIPGSVVIYFQQYDIAPYASGIPQFLIPFCVRSRETFVPLPGSDST